MHDALAITEADAQGLADLAQAQLRLANRFAERAEAAEDVDDACRLARASERAARGYRQSLLVKARLKRDAERDARDAAMAPWMRRTPGQEALVHQRVRTVYEAMEAIVLEQLEAGRLEDDPEQLLSDVLDHLEHESQDAAFLSEDLPTHVARTCHAFDLPTTAAPADAPATASARSPDSS